MNGLAALVPALVIVAGVAARNFLQRQRRIARSVRRTRRHGRTR